jgi:hypothetical protein
MSSKVAWIAFFVTLVFWLGQAGGCASNGDEQNYKLLEEDRPMFNTEPGGGAEADAPAQMNATATAEAAPAATVESASVAHPASDDQQSVTGIDRSQWGKVTVSPELGETHHWPHYFNDLALETPRTLDVTAEPMVSLHQAMSGTDAAPLTLINGVGTVVQPLKFAFDIAALPVYMVLTPPWKDVTTP